MNEIFQEGAESSGDGRKMQQAVVALNKLVSSLGSPITRNSPGDTYEYWRFIASEHGADLDEITESSLRETPPIGNMLNATTGRYGNIQMRYSLYTLGEVVDFPGDERAPITRAHLMMDVYDDPERTGAPACRIQTDYDIFGTRWDQEHGSHQAAGAAGLEVDFHISPQIARSDDLPPELGELWRDLRLDDIRPCPETEKGEPIFEEGIAGRPHHLAALTQFILDEQRLGTSAPVSYE